MLCDDHNDHRATLPIIFANRNIRTHNGHLRSRPTAPSRSLKHALCLLRASSHDVKLNRCQQGQGTRCSGRQTRGGAEGQGGAGPGPC